MAGHNEKYNFAVPNYFSFNNIDSHNVSADDDFFDQSVIGASCMVEPKEDENELPEDKKPKKEAAPAKLEGQQRCTDKAPERKVLAPSSSRPEVLSSDVRSRVLGPGKAPMMQRPQQAPAPVPRSVDPSKKRRSLNDMFNLENFAVLNPSQHTRRPTRERSPSPMRFGAPTSNRTSLIGATASAAPPAARRPSFGGPPDADKPRVGAPSPVPKSSTTSARTSFGGPSAARPSLSGSAAPPKTSTDTTIRRTATTRRSFSMTSNTSTTAAAPKEEGAKKAMTRRSFSVRSSTTTTRSRGLSPGPAGAPTITRSRGVSPGPAGASAQTSKSAVQSTELRRSERIKAMPKVFEVNKLKPTTTAAPKRWNL